MNATDRFPLRHTLEMNLPCRLFSSGMSGLWILSLMLGSRDGGTPFRPSAGQDHEKEREKCERGANGPDLANPWRN